MGSSVFLDFLA